MTERRGNADFTAQLQHPELRDAEAEMTVLVLDQLSTHDPAACRQQLSAQEARRLSRRFEWVTTPEHATMAELEWSVLHRQGQRPASGDAVAQALLAEETDRAARAVRANWPVVISAARDSLTRHDPLCEEPGSCVWSSTRSV